MRVYDLHESVDQPKRFWLATDIGEYNPKSVDDLARGRLRGLKGVSGSKEIVIQMFTVAKNTLIVMDAQQVIQQNHLTPIPYWDPEGLMADDMSHLYRLFDKRRDRIGQHGLMQNVAGYVLAYHPDPMMRHVSEWYALGQRLGRYYEKNPVEINTVGDLAQFMQQAIEQNQLDIKSHDNQNISAGNRLANMHQAVLAGLKKIATIYSTEAEWAIHRDTFIVPKGSLMLVAVSPHNLDLYRRRKAGQLTPDEQRQMKFFGQKDLDKFAEFMDVVENRMTQHYTVRLIDQKRYQEVRNQLWQKRSAAGLNADGKPL